VIQPTQIGPLDLGYGIVVQLLLVRRQRVQPEALARRHAARPARPLVGRRLRDGRHHQALHARARIVSLLLVEARVDHVDDAVDGQRGLGYVRRQNDLQ